LEGRDLAFFGVGTGLGAGGPLEGGGAVVQEGLRPGVREGGLNAELIAEVGDRDPIEEVAAPGSNFLLESVRKKRDFPPNSWGQSPLFSNALRGKMASGLTGHCGYLRGSIAANGG
jgi:hypothetical protein